MGVEVKKFNSILDTDLSEAEVDFFSHIDALNITFRGDGTNQRAQNIIGNTLLSNPGLPGAGTNTPIGAFYDQVKQRIITFNRNSDATHGIYIYNTVGGSWQTLLINGAATDGDILGFTLNGVILSIVIVYQEEGDGDILIYIDSLGRPTSINIDRYLNAPYAVTKRAFIDLAKAPARMAPRVVYENDNNVTVNNLLNALFRFRTRFVFDDNQKSVYSTGSIVPLPNQALNQTVTSDPTKNARIRVNVPTGDEDVTKIELWGQQTTNDVEESNWFLINSFNKSQLAIPDNSIYQFLFYNDSLYPAGDPREIAQLFDYVPIAAVALELLNGNTVIMANVTEGYDPVPINVDVTTEEFVPPYDIVNGLLFWASQSGLDSYGNPGDDITVYLTGAGVNDGLGNPISLNAADATYTVDCGLVNGTSVKFSYFNLHFDGVAEVLAGLVAAAEAQGFTLVGSIGTNSFTVSQANVELYYAQSVNNSDAALTNEASFCYTRRGAYTYALAYYDEKERTIGAQIPLAGGINTLEDLTGMTIPLIQININNRPPLEATHYSILRAPNLTYDKYLEWVCNQTFVNTDLDTGNQYAYIGYSNMDYYNKDIQTANPGGTPVVGYNFQMGDRIRFELQYPVAGGQNELSVHNDYQIVSTETDPIFNGVIQTGNFIKILYPSADVNANFQFGGDNYQNYKILIYSYTKRAISTQTEIYYEFGRMYGIGNPGSGSQFHIGSDQSQTSTLSQPAIVRMVDGDFFYRNRNVPTGLIYYPNSISHTITGLYATLATQNTNGVINNGTYQIGQQILGSFSDLSWGSYPMYSTTSEQELYWNQTANPNQIRITAQITITGDVALDASCFVLVKTAGGLVTQVFLQKNFFVAVSNATQSYILNVDEIIPIPPGAQAWLCWENVKADQSGVSTLTVGSFTFQLSVLNQIVIPVTDSSYSDSYAIITNSNLRALLYDPNARQNTYTTVLRWSLADQFGTNINQINRFYFENQDEADRSKGAIVRLKTRDRILRLFHQRACGEKGVYNTFIQDSAGQNTLTTTDAIITINNTKYYEGEFGMGNHPESLVSGKIQDYFFDPVRGYWVRLSNDGLIPISELYKGQYYLRSLITPYLQPYVRTDGGTALMLGCYNYFEEEWIGLLQAGTNGSATIAPYAIGFNERRNAFASKYSFNLATWILSAEDNFYTWDTNGQMWEHNNSQSVAPYSNFFGVQYDAYITTVFNQGQIQKKTYIGITELASTIWSCPVIYTDQMSYGTQRQQSYLIAANFQTLEGLFQTSFMRDTFSAGGWVNGYRLKGSWLAVQFSVPQASTFVWLSETAIKFIDSPLTPK